MTNTTMFYIHNRSTGHIDYFRTVEDTEEKRYGALEEYLPAHYSVQELAEVEIWESNRCLELTIKLTNKGE